MRIAMTFFCRTVLAVILLLKMPIDHQLFLPKFVVYFSIANILTLSIFF